MNIEINYKVWNASIFLLTFSYFFYIILIAFGSNLLDFVMCYDISNLVLPKVKVQEKHPILI